MKIIASDYDGTLNRGGVSQKDRDAIREWRENGNLFGIVTGRGEDMAKTVTEQNLDIDFIVVYNGTDVYVPDSEFPNVKLLHRFLGKSERLYEMLPLIVRKSGDWAEFITPDKRYYVTYNDVPAEGNSNWVKGEILKDVKEFIQIYALYDSEKDAQEVARTLNEKYSSDISPLVNVRWLNAAPTGVTKSSGVWEYAKIVGAEKENIFTIGDSYNDLDMIKTFNGFTVENAPDDIKKIAQAVYRGVWELIEAENK